MGDRKPEKLSKAQWRRVESMVASIKAIATGARRIDEEGLITLIYRAGISTVPDGYSSNSMPEFSSGSGSGNTPTEAAVLARQRRPADPLRSGVRNIEKHLDDAERSLAEATDLLVNLLSMPEAERGRLTSTPCPICLTLPIQKRGACRSCWREWDRAGRPDWHLWLLWKTEAKASDGSLLIAEQPKPRY